MSRVLIGCSGFHYKEWKDVFYPEGLPQSKWFQFYCEHFDTLELNTTFYKFPSVKSLQKWFHDSPEHFRFSLKVPGLITHYKRFSECEKYLEDFYSVCSEGLLHKLGCILFQLHPQIKYSEEMLQFIISNLNPAYKNIIEFRDKSWWNQSVYKTLKRHKIVFSGISYPNLPDEIVKTQPVLYYRFHGVPVLYKSSYHNDFLEEKLSAIQNSSSSEAWIYFNNTWGTAAISNAGYLKNLLRKS